MIIFVAYDFYERAQSNRLVKEINELTRTPDSEKHEIVNEIARLTYKTKNLDKLSGYEFMRWIDLAPTTPMLTACGRANYETVKLLIENGASVNYVKGSGSSPLSHVLLNSHFSEALDVAELLLENGADPNFKYFPDGGDDADSIFYYHCRQMIALNDDSFERDTKSYKIIELLLKYGADPNEKCAYDKGNTVLMLIAQKEGVNLDLFELLLSYGTDISIKNDDGKTAYNLAVESGNTAYLEMLF